MRYVAIIAVVLFLCATLAQAGTSDAWYPFNGNANDESENGYHGTVTGAALCEDRCIWRTTKNIDLRQKKAISDRR